MGRTPFEHSDGEQFTTKEDLEKYWSRTVGTIYHTPSYIHLHFAHLVASRKVGWELQDVQSRGEVAPEDDCS